MRARTAQRSKIPFRFRNVCVTRALAVAVLVVGFCLGRPCLFESAAQPLSRGEAQPHSAREVKPGQTLAPIGNSGYLVPIPEIKMKSIIGNEPSRTVTVPPPKEQSSAIPARPKEQPPSTEVEKPGRVEPPAAAKVPAASNVDRLPFESVERRPILQKPLERSPVRRPLEKEYRSPLIRPPNTPEDVIAAPAPKKQILGKKTNPTIPPLLVLQPQKVALKATSLGWARTQDEAGSQDQILLDPRREPEVIPPIEPPLTAQAEPEKEAEPELQKVPEKDVRKEPLKEAEQELRKAPEQEVRNEPLEKAEAEPQKTPEKAAPAELLKQAEQELRKAPEQEVRDEPLKKAEAEPQKTPEKVAPAELLKQAQQELRKAAEQEVRNEPLKKAELELQKAPEKEVLKEPAKEPLKEALLSPQPEPFPSALTPPAAEEPAQPEQSLRPVEKPVPPVKELPPSPLAANALDSPQVKRYLRATAPVLEELSLLMTKAPSLNLADYDPSDANAPIVPKEVYLKMDSLKRELQNLDSKTFAIIPPPKYAQYHAVIRRSITETYEACDAIISYLNERNDENLRKILEHLSKARELIRETRTVQG